MRYALLTVLLPALAFAQQPPPRPATDMPLLTVTGTAEASAVPDRATLRLGALAQADSAANAQSQVSGTVEKILEALKDLGIPAADVSTSTLSLTPVYATPPRNNADPNFQPKIIAYRADNTLEVRLADLKKVGPAIDAAIAAGSNQVESLTFDLKDDTAPRNAALADAVRQARAKAELLAKTANVSLVYLHDLEESGATNGPIPFQGGAMRAMAAAAPTPISPGQIHLSATVTLRYAITPAQSPAK